MKTLRTLIFAFMLGVSVICAVQYVMVLREKIQVQAQLQAQESRIAVLESEKETLHKTIDEERQLRQKIAEESIQLKDTLRASKRRISKLFDVYLESSRQIERVSTQTALLKSEVSDLRESYHQLEEKFTQLQAENTQYKATMDSVVELKKAIREAKRKARQAKKRKVVPQPVVLIPVVSQPVQEQALPELARAEDDTQGNRGYIVKDGKPTYSSRVKIEVTPVVEDAPSSVQ